MLATFSEYRRLGRDRLQELQHTLREAIIGAGGRVRGVCGTYVWCSRRTSACPPYQRHVRWGAFRARLGFWSSAPASATKSAGSSAVADSRVVPGALDPVIAACRPGRG